MLRLDRQEAVLQDRISIESNWGVSQNALSRDASRISRGWFHVRRNQLGQFKHADLIPSVKKSSEFVIGIDALFVRGILQASRFDVIPHSLGDFGPGQGLIAHDRGQNFVRLDRFG